MDVWASWVSPTPPDTFFFWFVFKETFFVFLSVLALKFCSSVCCFPQNSPPPPFLSKDSVGTPSVPLENSSYLKCITQFPPPRPNYMFSVHNSLLFIIFGAMRLCGVFLSHRHSPFRDIWSLRRARSPMTHQDIGHCAEKLGGTSTSPRSPRNTVFPIFPS